MRHWSNKYLAIPHNKMNCSKFVEHVLRDHFKKDYEFPQSQGSLFNQSQQIRDNLPKFCKRTQEYKDGDLVLMHGLRMMCHVGLYVGIRGTDYVLHCESSMKTSALHRFIDISRYGYTIQGVYEWLE